MKPWYRNSTLQMDDPEMQWLQSQDPASCAVWEWLKGDCQKRGTNEVRKLSDREIEIVTRNLGIDSPKFSQISQNLHSLGWIAKGVLKGWSKWQASRTAEEDATRKQLDYWKSEAERLRKNLPQSPKTSHSLPKPPLEERRGEERRSEVQTPPIVPQLVSIPSEILSPGRVSDFKDGLNRAYERPENERWGYEEERLAVEVCKRQNCFSELTTLIEFRQKKGKFFPQSIESLLSNWQKTLDAARNGHSTRESPSVVMKALQEEIDIHPANRESASYRQNCTPEMKADLKAKRDKYAGLRSQVANG